MKNTRFLKRLTIATIILFILVFTLADRKGPTVIKHKAVFSPPKKTKTLIVKEGECLSLIADRIKNFSWRDLAKLNDMEENPSSLREGRPLIIPAEE